GRAAAAHRVDTRGRNSDFTRVAGRHTVFTRAGASARPARVRLGPAPPPPGEALEESQIIGDFHALWTPWLPAQLARRTHHGPARSARPLTPTARAPHPHVRGAFACSGHSPPAREAGAVGAGLGRGQCA